MVEEYHLNAVYPDVRWSLIAALGSLGLLSLVLFLCAKKDNKKKDKRAEQTNGTSNQTNSKDVHIDIIPQFTAADKPEGNPGHQNDNVQVAQNQRNSGNISVVPFSNNNAHQQAGNRGSGFDYHYPAEKDKSSSKKDSSKNQKKSKKDKSKSEKRLSANVEKRVKEDKDKEKEKKSKKKSDGSLNSFEAPVGIPPGVPAKVPLPVGVPITIPALPSSELQSLPLPTHPIEVANLDAYLRDAQTTGEIPKQYKAIPRSMGYTTEDSEKPEQREKNRYRNIVPYDYNRVKLDLLPKDPNSHYINASLIDNFYKTKQYIASQGPIESTIKDFWRMIWEHNITVIVMVTNPWERGMKCLMYWPEGESSLKFGDIEIFLEKKDMTVLPDYTVRNITARKGETQRQITQLQFRTWPDHGVPRHAMALLNFRDKVRSEVQHLNTPILIHCSAGVGRTGTFLAIDQLLDQAKDEQMIDVPDCVCRLRKQRSDLVQTVEQYGFIYQAVLEYLVLGQTTIPCFKFEDMFTELQTVEKDGKTRLKRQFEMLDQFMAERVVASNLIALEEENRPKNRSSKIIPTDEVRRVKLLSQLEDHSNYINAVFADGHRRAGSFIATEAPMENTIVDFWRMIHEYQCSIIIMLNPVKNLKEDELYFPLGVGEKIECTPFEVECLEKKESQGIEIRKLRMHDLKEKKEIYHMALSSDLQMNAEELLEKTQALHNKIMRRQLSHKDPAGGQHSRPVVAHCLNGVHWTGFLIVLCHLFDQINNDQEVDIFNAVRQSRLARSQFVESEEQYTMLHDVVKLYIDSFETYSNFK